MAERQRVRWRGDSDSSTESSKGTPSATSGSSENTNPTRYSLSSEPQEDKEPPHRSPYPSQAIMSTESTVSWSSSDSSITEPEEQLPGYGVQSTCQRYLESNVLPASSRDFAELFPSSRKLLVHHDDTTLDGNMNLRVDTPVTSSRGVQKDVTLFHLRMYNLRCRDFSLRRYCRDSGREICHCVRKSHKSILGARPNIQRSLSNAFAAMIPRPESRQHRQSKLTRHDSGSETIHTDQEPEEEEEEEEEERPHSSHSNKAPDRDAANLMNLEFSNYAHVDIKRRGFKADKHYEFDYWGTSYSWHRSTQKMGKSREVSYHLTRRNGTLVARIVPEALSYDEARHEEDKGGWISPCSLRILDQQITDERLTDVADVVVSTGLMVLVDDNIRRHFHHQEHPHRGFRMPMITGLTDRKDKTSSARRTEASQDGVHHKMVPELL